MKKLLIVSLNVLVILILSKYLFASYKISYKLNNYSISTNYKNNRYYFEIEDNKKRKFNFDMYHKRTLSKVKISQITEIKGDDFLCIYPTIKGYKTYPLCYKNNELVDYNLIDSNLLNKYKNNYKDEEIEKDFVYYNSLNDNTFIALWNYKGYIVMNGKSYQKVELFEKDRYNNELSYQLNNKIYMPNYDMEHEFSEIVVLNIKDLTKKTIKLEYNIDYDSYVVGSVKNMIYIYDNKHSILYEIDTKKDRVNIVGSNKKGYTMYKNNEFVSCSKTLYSVKKIKYNDININSNYKYVLEDGTYKEYKDNLKIKTKIFENKINILKQYKNELYYLEKDTLFIYKPETGSKKVFYNYELEFNSNNSTFIYIK